MSQLILYDSLWALFVALASDMLYIGDIES
jgi:hypothetical protein